MGTNPISIKLNIIKHCILNGQLIIPYNHREPVKVILLLPHSTDCTGGKRQGVQLCITELPCSKVELDYPTTKPELPTASLSLVPISTKSKITDGY